MPNAAHRPEENQTATSDSEGMTSSGKNATPPLQIATPLRRFAALIYDLFLLAAISLAYGGIILAARVFIQGDDGAQQDLSGPLRAIFLIGWWGVIAIFYGWCWRRVGQTLGMKTWHIRLEQTNGRLLTWRLCYLRSLVAPPMLLFFGLSYWWCLFNRPGHCLHDVWSSSQVVVLEKETKKKA